MNEDLSIREDLYLLLLNYVGYRKEDYTGISLNSKHKKEIIEFIEKYIPSEGQEIQ